MKWKETIKRWVVYDDRRGAQMSSLGRNWISKMSLFPTTEKRANSIRQLIHLIDWIITTDLAGAAIWQIRGIQKEIK